MILKEALIGGTVYLDYDKTEMALPENDRVAFCYRALTNREKVDLLHVACDEKGLPNFADVCKKAVTSIKNLYAEDGVTPIDTIDKILSYTDKDNVLAYMLVIVGTKIWIRQAGEEVGLKNSQ